MLYIPFPFKPCSKCAEWYRPTTEFFRLDKRRNALGGICRRCHRASVATWQKENPDKVKARNQRYKEKHLGEVRERQRHYDLLRADEKRKDRRRRLEAEPEKIRAQKRRWIEKNPDKQRRSVQEWGRNNREKTREATQRRRSQKRHLKSTFTERNWHFALNYFHGVCAFCRNPPSLFDKYPTLHREHFIPQSKGGEYTPDNILPACQHCNCSKNDSDPIEWLLKRFGKKQTKRILERIQRYFSLIVENNHDDDLFRVP